MSTVNAIADVQPGQEVALPERGPSELTGSKFTAEQIEKDCPAMLQDLGKRIAVHSEKAQKCKEKANQHYNSIAHLLATAHRACEEGGFAAFREMFFPKLGKSRVYELLAIGTRKKSVEDTKAGTRGRVAKHRAKKAEASPNSVTVTEYPKPEPEALSAPTENGAVQATNPAREQTPEPANTRSLGMPSHNVLLEVTARVDDLIRRIGKREPIHFTGIGGPTDRIVKLAIFLLDVANYKEPGIVKLIPIIAQSDNSTVSAEQSAEDVRTDDGRLAALMPKRADD
jgi:hypothetical protein